jgi:outer membrane protein TolC
MPQWLPPMQTDTAPARARVLATAGVVALLFYARDARADLVARALDAGGGGAAPAAATGAGDVDDLGAWAGAPRPTSLPELLRHAIQQAPALASAKIDIAVAEARIAQTWARNDWQVKSQLTVGSSTGSFSGIAIDRQTQVALSGDLIRALPTGGTIDLHAISQYNRTSSSLGNSTQWFDELSGSITQPLLRGRGQALFDANEKKAGIARDVAALSRQLAAIQMVQAVVAAYWDLVSAERDLAITRTSLDLTRERLRVTQVGVDGGKIARSELPAVQQIIATRQEDVLTGELAVVNASIALRRAVGLPIGAGELTLHVDTDLELRDGTFDLGALVERAYGTSPELAQLGLQDGSSTLDIEVTENGLLPQLDAALTLGPAGQDASFGRALANLVELKQLAISGSLTYSRSIEQRDVRGRARELRAAREKLRVNAFDLRAQIAQTMARAVGGLELARRRVVLSQRAIDLAKENIAIETSRFTLGKSTNFDILNRQEELRQAELRKAHAQIDWHKAEGVVLALTGELLPAFGIALE